MELLDFNTLLRSSKHPVDRVEWSDSDIPLELWEIHAYLRFWAISDDAERKRVLQSLPPEIIGNLFDVHDAYLHRFEEADNRELTLNETNVIYYFDMAIDLARTLVEQGRLQSTRSFTR